MLTNGINPIGTNAYLVPGIIILKLTNFREAIPEYADVFGITSIRFVLVIYWLGYSISPDLYLPNYCNDLPFL